MSPWNSKAYDAPSEKVQDLADRRNRMDLSQKDIAKALEQDPDYKDRARATIAGHISKWERAKSEPDEDDLEAYERALDAIEAERNKTNPACSDPECSTSETSLEPAHIGDDAYCQVCYYTRMIEPVDDDRELPARLELGESP